MLKEFYFQWHITNSCNLRCIHCYQEDFTSKNDLNWTTLKKIADNIINTLTSWNKSGKITLTGGEPFLKKDIFILLEYLNKQNQISGLEVITNATLLDNAVFERLKRISKLRLIKFSLDGMTSENNDSIRGEGSYSRTLNSIKQLNGRRFKKVLMFTLLKSNVKDVPRVFQFCKDLDISGVILERFIPWGRGLNIKGEVLSSQDWSDLVELLIELCQLNCSKEDLVKFKAFWVKFGLRNKINVLGAPCMVARDGLCIMPDGSVFPCRRFNLSIGNLQNTSLRDIWQTSFVLETLRSKKNILGNCRTCYVKDCIGCRAIAHALTGNFLKSDPQCYIDN